MQNLEVVAEQKRQKAITVSTIAKSPKMVSRFADVLGGTDKANQFLASLISAVNGNSNLMKCDPSKVMACAMVSASLNLDVNPNLGLASIVPYKRKYKDENGQWHEEQVPQFQIGWKGFVQLAMRSGQYRTMNVTEVYADEFDGYDPFKGELQYHLVNGGDRDNDRKQNVVGYAFYFELTSGYSKMAYMSKEKAKAHALRYSRAYQNDLKYKTTSSPWSTMFDEMACKTVVKLNISKWGVLSTQLAKASMADQSTTDMDEDGNVDEFEYIDNSDPSEIVDAKAEKVEKTPQIPPTEDKATEPVEEPTEDISENEFLF